MNFVIEAENLKNCTPATVSRCGIIYVDSRTLNWEMLIKSFFLKEFPQAIIKFKDLCMESTIYCIEATLAYIGAYGSFPMTFSDMKLV